ncbi:Oidioi.mRNA.OKI2018_I69.PAR.g9771.t1.cds [Oikopleura dioica]|uniref:Oidioi.mRNA.OKI2018_I69.PAR.g9771.t1.cds n=1 Tax=Oikopleura dioica TaxID=34765 RepID=A0ABN7RRK5_OIKDI|nr:Oidioi.mRNA.OKI2018_I69.PAR.g9771.t1.cds [Oikopleura dioica]
MSQWTWDQSAQWVQKSINDPAMDCNPRVLESLVRLEEKYMPISNYFSLVQKNVIAPWMRQKVTMWMLEVCEETRTAETVFSLAVNMMDRFLSVCTIRRSELQLLGAATLFLSAKLRESFSPLTEVEVIVAYTDRSITAQQLLDMELLILLKLKWDLYGPVAKDFIKELVQLLPDDISKSDDVDLVARHASTYADVVAIDEKFIMVPPSMIAACCVTAAVCGNEKFPKNTPEGILARMQAGIGVENDFLKSCYSTVAESLKSAFFSDSGSDSGVNDSSMSSENSSATLERVTPDEVDENV